MLIESFVKDQTINREARLRSLEFQTGILREKRVQGLTQLQKPCSTAGFLRYRQRT
jgi:hypothetical protein